MDKCHDDALRLDGLNRWNGVAIAGQQRNPTDSVLDCQKRHVDAHHHVDTLLDKDRTTVFTRTLKLKLTKPDLKAGYMADRIDKATLGTETLPFVGSRRIRLIGQAMIVIGSK